MSQTRSTLVAATVIIAATALKAFNQTMKTRFRDVTNDAGSIGPETAQSH